VALALFASACATPAPKREPLVFFPPPPAPPRLQYLTSFSGLKDIEQQSAFNRFVIGEKVNVRLDKPYGVALHGGKIYVCDTNATVVVFDLVAKTFGMLAGAEGAGKLVQPLNISIDGDGNKYVSDSGRGQVVVFDRDDRFVRAIGGEVAWRPVDAVPFEDRLYVADYENRVVKVFAKQSGELLRTIGDTGEPAERLDRPTNLAFDADGHLWVTDFGRFQIIRFDRDGHFKLAVGMPGDNLGNFARPKGIAVDRAGNLYAVDASFNNVQIFNREGRLLLFFSGPGFEAGQLQLPADVAIDYDNVGHFRDFAGPDFEIEYLVLVTSQFGPRQVNIFGFGRDRNRKYPTEAEIREQIEQRRKKEMERQQPPPP
jgi:DNA-binding beta-propeller fold protein YncE